jgi:hypothetical protein
MSDIDNGELPAERRMATWPASKRCGNCKFWFDKNIALGRCRRYPQEVLTEFVHFCGEFKECSATASNNPKWKKPAK